MIKPPPAPPFCPHIFRDSRTIYLEFEKMTLAFDFCEGGLNKALKHIPDITLHPGYVGSTPSANRLLPKTKQVKLNKKASVSHDEAVEIMKLLEVTEVVEKKRVRK